MRVASYRFLKVDVVFTIFVTKRLRSQLQRDNELTRRYQSMLPAHNRGVLTIVDNQTKDQVRYWFEWKVVDQLDEM